MFPDAVNQPAFPPIILRPGGQYQQQTVWRLFRAAADGSEDGLLTTCAAGSPKCKKCKPDEPQICLACRATHRLTKAGKASGLGGRGGIVPAGLPHASLIQATCMPCCLQCVPKKKPGSAGRRMV